MRISKFVAALTVCAVCAAPMPANAQFLKKLGDALSKADKVLSKKSDKSKSQKDNLVDMPGVTLEVLDVYHEGLGAMVDFKISNSSQNVYDITFNGTDGLDGWAKSQAVGADGQARKCYVSVIGDHEGLDMVTRHRLMPGTTSFGSFKISNLSHDIKSLNNFSIAGLWQANEDNNNHNFNFIFNGPVAITTPENTNVGTSAVQGSAKESGDTVTGVRKGANLVATLRQFKSITWDYNADFGVIANVPGMWIVVDEADLTPEGLKVINAITSDMENGIRFSIDYIKPTAKVGEFEKN